MYQKPRVNCWWNWPQVSISSTFMHSFKIFSICFCKFANGKIAAYKMWIKLTSVCRLLLGHVHLWAEQKNWLQSGRKTWNSSGNFHNEVELLISLNNFNLQQSILTKFKIVLESKTEFFWQNNVFFFYIFLGLRCYPFIGKRTQKFELLANHF